MTYIIAEMAFSHDGQEILALEIATAVSNAKADALSIHITDMPSYMVKHYGSGPGRVSAGKDTKPIYDYLEEINPSNETWTKVADQVRKDGLDLIIMPNDLPSLEFSESLNPDAYVLSAAAFVDQPFVSAIALKKRKIYLRVGGATLGEIADTIAALNKAGNTDLVLLFGHQNYPTSIENTDLLFLKCLKETFGLPVGLADHIDAEDELATIIPLMSLTLGATVIEKHITHNRNLKGEDHESALNPDELTNFVKRVRMAEKAMGSRYASALASSGQYRLVSRKRLVAARDLAEGQILTEDDFMSKRSDEGACPSEYQNFLGKKMLRNLKADRGLDFNLVTST
ncbi:N-acetylneuraminate synthase family protein [Kiloniella litopenaei]|uniref:N-acetylneuraminate synthase family protein n=1 Tax=Kiloniella litopenaei TaxID=1549748 RepID=UPI003BAA13BC